MNDLAGNFGRAAAKWKRTRVRHKEHHDLKPSQLGLWYDDYRPGQFEAIWQLIQAPTRFKLLEAPTGTGKTAVYVSAALALGGRTLVVVINRGLQDQLAEFSRIGAVDIRGHSNYDCSDKSSDEVECLNDRGTCGQDRQRKLAKRAKIVITNLAMWSTMRSIGGTAAEALGEFDNLIVDEVHTVPNMLTEKVGVKFGWKDFYNLAKFNVCQTLRYFPQREWCRVAIDKIDAVTVKSASMKLQLRRMRRDLIRFLVEADETWVLQMIDGDIICQPIFPFESAERHLFAGIKNVILTAAFIPRRTPARLGIKDESCTWVHMPSPFDPRRNPFYYWPIVEVDFNMSGEERRKWIRAMDEIIVGRLDRKGINHCRSYQYAESIFSLSQAKPVLITHGPGETRAAIDNYLRSTPPAVLLTPSMVEGYNLPYDDCMYQILGKVPFDDIRAPMAAARHRWDKFWRIEQTALSVYQAAGRANRHADDLSENFMLDAHWGDFRRRAEFPQSFKDTWVDIDFYDELPQAPLRPDWPRR